MPRESPGLKRGHGVRVLDGAGGAEERAQVDNGQDLRVGVGQALMKDALVSPLLIANQT